MNILRIVDELLKVQKILGCLRFLKVNITKDTLPQRRIGAI